MKQVDRPFYLDCNNPRRNSSLAYSLACGAFVATTGYPRDTVHAMLSIFQVRFSEITGNAYTVVYKGLANKIDVCLKG